MHAGLATPDGVGEGQRLEHCEDGKERAEHLLDSFRKSSEFGVSMSLDKTETSRRETEVAHVRAVLAHITNNVNRINHAKPNVVPPPLPPPPSKLAAGSLKSTTQHGSKHTLHHGQENQITDQIHPSAPAREAGLQEMTKSARPPARAQTRSQAAVAIGESKSPPEINDRMENKPRPNSTSNPKPPPPPPRRANARAAKSTVPKSPFLRSKQRSTLNRVAQVTKTTEEMELEKLEKAREEAKALRLRNARSVATVLRPQSQTRIGSSTQGSRPPATKRPVTEPKEFNFRTAKRQRVHGMATRSMVDKEHQKDRSNRAPATAGATRSTRPSPWKSTAQKVAQFACGRTCGSGTTINASVSRGMSTSRPTRKSGGANTKPKLTKPKTPRFATTARQRGSRFKPTEEEELEKALKEARDMKSRLKQAEVSLPRATRRTQKTTKPPLTQAEPFSFATDARAAQRRGKQSQQSSGSAVPPPFVFGSLPKDRRVTRSQVSSRCTTRTVLSTAKQSRTARPKSSPTHTGNLPSDRIEQLKLQKLQKQQEQKPDEDTNIPVWLDSNEPVGQRNSMTQRRKTTFLSGKARRVLRTDKEDEQINDDDVDHEGEACRAEDVDDLDIGHGPEHYAGGWHMEECDGMQQDKMQDIIRAGTTLHNPLFRL